MRAAIGEEPQRNHDSPADPQGRYPPGSCYGQGYTVMSNAPGVHGSVLGYPALPVRVDLSELQRDRRRTYLTVLICACAAFLMFIGFIYLYAGLIGLTGIRDQDVVLGELLTGMVMVSGGMGLFMAAFPLLTRFHLS